MLYIHDKPSNYNCILNSQSLSAANLVTNGTGNESVS